MSKTFTPTSIQEAAAKFANNTLARINSSIANMAGVDVMWFRLLPDKKNQDVIFQTYTLYGVEDCPLQFKAMYSDSGYNDAAITYNIMGLEYSVPLTLDIACNTWYTVTEHDGTLPQRGDIVFIPLSKKLLEVVSMTPVKAMGAQVTSYKVNLSVYKPSKNRIVGDNLQTAIDNNTVNLDSAFGKEIKETIQDIVDDKQLSPHNSTVNDEHKKLTAQRDEESGKITVESIVSSNLVVDGHTVARSYYNMNKSDIIVQYKFEDSITAQDTRCFSCWINIDELITQYKNVQSLTPSDDRTSITVKATANFKQGSKVVIERGQIVILGEVISDNPYIISVNPDDLKRLDAGNPNWYRMPGFVIKIDDIVDLLSADGKDEFNLSIHNFTEICMEFNGKRMLYHMQTPLKPTHWYGVIINISSTVNIDIYESENGLARIISMTDQKNRLWKDYSYLRYFLKGTHSKMTNIRYYNCANTVQDKQIIDLITYNNSNDSKAIINDSADPFLDKTYTGRQR